MTYGEHLFLLWEVGVWVAEVSHVGTACYPGQQGLSEIPWLATLCTCCHISLIEELRTSPVWFPWTPESLYLVSPGLYPIASSPLPVIMCPFAVINC